MNSSSVPIIIDEINDNNITDSESEDAFLQFIDYAKSAIYSEEENDGAGEGNIGPSWSWIVSLILKTCSVYSSGVTAAILLSDLSQALSEQYRPGAPKRRPECITQLKKKHRRTKLPNTVTIDSIYEKNFLSEDSVLEAVVVDVYVLPGTNIYMLSLGDFWSSGTIDLYLHWRYYDLVCSDYPDNGILKKGRQIFLTGCRVRTTGNSGYPRLLPTEYIVVLLDENEDDDGMLLGALCSDSFSSISSDAVDAGASYSFYARIQTIGSLETLGRFSDVKRKQVTLVDNDGMKLNFLLWGEQVLLASLFSVGGLLALDKPFISSALHSNIETTEAFCLEFGSCTQLYLVPFIQQEEQICVASTQNRYQGSRLPSGLKQSQELKVSQVSLPCDSHGSVDFSNYPLRSFVRDLRDKMVSISLYGIVTDIFRDENAAEAVFVLRMEDTTGAVLAKLHFVKSWSLGRLSSGHTIYISGLTCCMSSKKMLEVSWFEKDKKASLVNISGLPALLNSSCLHKLSYLSNLSSQSNTTHICNVRLVHIEPCDLNSRFSHVVCGHCVKRKPNGTLECEFCHDTCDGQVMPTFRFKVILADESTKVLAWCIGQTAAELLQISPNEFYELAEDDQAMYLCTLENEKFMVAIVNCKRQTSVMSSVLKQETEPAEWEITRALKRE